MLLLLSTVGSQRMLHLIICVKYTFKEPCVVELSWLHGEAPRVGIITVFGKIPVDKRVSYFTHFLSNPNPYYVSVHYRRKLLTILSHTVKVWTHLQYFVMKYSNVLSFKTGSCKSTSSTSDINQQMHIYNFHLKHFKTRKTTPTYFDLRSSSGSFVVPC